MKFALVIFLFHHPFMFPTDRFLANTRTHQQYLPHEEEQCKVDAVIQTKTLPLEPGNAARYQYATCVQISS